MPNTPRHRVLFKVAAPYSCAYLRSGVKPHAMANKWEEKGKRMLRINATSAHVMLMLFLVFLAANASEEMSSLAFEQMGVTMKDTKKGLTGMWLPKLPV